MINSAVAVGEHRFGNGTRRTQAGRYFRRRCSGLLAQRVLSQVNVFGLPTLPSANFHKDAGCPSEDPALQSLRLAAARAETLISAHRSSLLMVGH